MQAHREAALYAPNPVKRGLVEKREDWRWSSFRHYAFMEKGTVEIESEWEVRKKERTGTPLGVTRPEGEQPHPPALPEG